MRSGVACIAVALVLAVGGVCRAADPGRDLVEKIQKLDDGERFWTDRKQTLALHIFDAGGSERNRSLIVYSLQRANYENRAIVFLSEPPEVRGTAFLQWSHPHGDDDQWLYLPSLKRTRRVAGRIRGESFVGTDFSYYDFEVLWKFFRWYDDEAPAALVGEDHIDGDAVYVVERRPKQAGALYGQVRAWLAKDRLVPLRFQFYGTDGVCLKELTQSGFRDIESVPTPQRQEMRQLKEGTRTLVDILDVTYNVGLAEDSFSERYLERGKL